MPVYFPSSSPKIIAETYGLQLFFNNAAMPEEMRFALQVPSGFSRKPKETIPPGSDRPVADLAYFKSESGDIELIVQCSYIKYEVSLENYYQYTLQPGEKLLDKRLINDEEDKPDMLTQRSFPDGALWINRRTGYKIWNGSGAFIITANIATAQDNYLKYADLFCAVINTLKPLPTPEWKLAETLALVSRRYPVDFATYIPTSWKEYHHHSDTVDEMNLVYTKTLHASISGIISMCCMATHKVGGTEAMLRKCQRGYTDQGYDLSNTSLTKTDDLSVFSNVMRGTVNIPQEKGNPQKENNITFYIAKKNNNWIYMEMFGPARNTDFEAWALNDRALELMKEKMAAI